MSPCCLVSIGNSTFYIKLSFVFSVENKIGKYVVRAGAIQPARHSTLPGHRMRQRLHINIDRANRRRRLFVVEDLERFVILIERRIEGRRDRHLVATDIRLWPTGEVPSDHCWQAQLAQAAAR